MARYITTTLPYVNSTPHIGFASEILRADALARYYALMGEDVFFNTGTDEHGQKIYEAALQNGETPQAYTDRYAEQFRGLIPLLGLSENIHFIRTTDPHHVSAAQEMWRRCEKAGDIYKTVQKINYCIGCELEKTDSELEDGVCPIHPKMPLEVREEENYFFKFSKYQQQLLELYKNNPHFVIPEFRQHEITKFVEAGLHDFSISRLKEKMPWGVPVPGDDAQVMYVWFDALTNYISTTGWPEQADFGGYWPGIQLAGKDNLRQQSAIWQAMLMSAGLPNSTQIYIGGFINSGGQKMSKSLGNVIAPTELVAKYGVEATRYLLLRHVHPFEDTDITWERLDEWYTANLVNGLGNLVARVMKLAETYLDAPIDIPAPAPFPRELTQSLEGFAFHEAMDYIWSRIGDADARMTAEEPFKVVKVDEAKGKQIISELVSEVYWIGRFLNPFMPKTNELIKQAVKDNKKPDNLFPRLP